MRKIPNWIKVAPILGLGLFALVVIVRLLLASFEVRNDLQALDAVTPMTVGETSRLEILPLYEQAASRPDLQSGLGVSYLIRTDTATILFDMGNNPDATNPSPLEQNMEKLGVNFDQVDVIVFSHTHVDHTGGQYWRSKGTFGIGGDTQVSLGARPVYLPEPLAYPGSTPVLSKSPRKIAEGVATTGAIPYVSPFPAWLAVLQGVEQALVVNVKDRGIVIITGCGHMGLDSLLAHAQAEFDAPVVGFIGGLHEGNANAQALEPGIQLLNSIQPEIVAVSPHDSSPSVLAVFKQAFQAVYQPIEVGSLMQIPLHP
jgi:7,8-dihydropterin-6-yl-methyl-4-(beta-D-ribofuranosyl)aminobenzene 5'-phosphate synthase